MKYLTIGLLVLSGCAFRNSDYHATQESELKFHAGQRVKVISGFYNTCFGRILEYSQVTVDGDGPSYHLALLCQDYAWKDERVLQKDMIPVNEYGKEISNVH